MNKRQVRRPTIWTLKLMMELIKPSIRPSMLCGTHFEKNMRAGVSRKASTTGLKTNAFRVSSHFTLVSVWSVSKVTATTHKLKMLKIIAQRLNFLVAVFTKAEL